MFYTEDPDISGVIALYDTPPNHFLTKKNIASAPSRPTIILTPRTDPWRGHQQERCLT